jgi:hypothetical protein
MWEFRLIELLTFYSWFFTDTRLHYLDNVKLKESLHSRPSVSFCFSIRLIRNKI